MKPYLPALIILIVVSVAFGQSGRRAKIPSIPPPASEPSPSPTPTPTPEGGPGLTAEKNQTYRCSEDESLARVLDTDANSEPVFTSKTVDVQAQISSRPRAAYTREARRANVEGNVVLSVVLSSNGKVGPIKVLRALPVGLTTSAIRAACKIEFKPATKEGKAVSQLLNVEYAFRLSDPLISGP